MKNQIKEMQRKARWVFKRTLERRPKKSRQ